MPVAQMILDHHERLDGSGYPRGIGAEDISVGARILSVAEVVEAMQSHRPYRAGLGLEVALREIEAGRSTLYDADVVAYPGGVVDRVVALSTGDYNVHFIGVNWPHHVFVNPAFTVTGAE